MKNGFIRICLIHSNSFDLVCWTVLDPRKQKSEEKEYAVTVMTCLLLLSSSQSLKANLTLFAPILHSWFMISYAFTYSFAIYSSLYYVL